MENILETVVKGKYVGNVVIDTEPTNPREDSNLGTMICFHKRYMLGDEQSSIKPNEFKSWEDLMRILVNDYGASVILPLYLFDHSSASMSVTPFNDHWDSGQVGFIYVTDEKIAKETREFAKEVTDEFMEKAEELLKAEVDTYNRYLEGNTYCIEIYEKQECDLCYTHLESVSRTCGFDSIDEAMATLNDELSYLTKEDKELEEKVE